jgi:exopolysaccharide production protein ExoZ
MIANIQALRAIAAISVVYFHTKFEWFKFGSFGVDIFFVVSGYIMSNICDNDSVDFLKRRLLRIVPLYWFFTLCLFFIASTYPTLVNTANSQWIDLSRSLLFFPYRNQNGLMQPELFLGWTLNYEMFFYLTISIALAIVPPKYAIGLAGTLVVLILLAIRSSGCGSDVCQFYGNGVVLEFVLGIIAYKTSIYLSTKMKREYYFVAISLIILASFLLIAVNVRLSSAYVEAPIVILINQVPDGFFKYVLISVPAVLCFILVLIAVLCETIDHKLNYQWILMLGNASYVIYLVHPYIIEGFDRIVAPYVPFLTTRTLAGMVLSVTAILIASVTFHVLVERKIVKIGRELLERRRGQQTR